MRTPAEIELANKYHSYTRGWRDGAAAKAMDPKFTQHPTLGLYYQHGYTDGIAARNEAAVKAKKRFGYTPNILRGAATEPVE